MTALGGLAMMVGFVMVGVVTGTFSISELTHNEGLRGRLTASPLFLPALLLILAGAFTKSAQVPFHFWLPAAMVAPTPVSTYLHAATMVKAGIFLVGRMLPIFESSPVWSPIVITFGLATFVLGAYQSFRETDLKVILARTTLSTLGLVMMIYGLKAAEQDALQILNHAAYKGALFLVVGIVEHFTHTRDLTKLGGLKKDLPITFWVCVLAGLSMAGLPPFFGFVAKEIVVRRAVGEPGVGRRGRSEVARHCRMRDGECVCIRGELQGDSLGCFWARSRKRRRKCTANMGMAEGMKTGAPTTASTRGFGFRHSCSPRSR